MQILLFPFVPIIWGGGHLGLCFLTFPLVKMVKNPIIHVTLYPIQQGKTDGAKGAPGRPKMRKADGTLLHPPKKPKLSTPYSPTDSLSVVAANGQLTITPASNSKPSGFPGKNA